MPRVIRFRVDPKKAVWLAKKQEEIEVAYAEHSPPQEQVRQTPTADAAATER